MRLVDSLVRDDGASNEEGPSESGLSGPGTSKRVFLATQTLRVNTPEMVLGMSQALHLPEGHPLICTVYQAFGAFGVQG